MEYIVWPVETKTQLKLYEHGSYYAFTIEDLELYAKTWVDDKFELWIYAEKGYSFESTPLFKIKK